jgi:tRNA pseudouridine55 synthase
LRPDGVLVIDKPGGQTSRSVVSRVAGLTGASKAGHTGTLDPLATGVLVVCLGKATVLSSYLAAGAKSYVTEALLGVRTDTYDIEGEVLERRDTSGTSENHIARVLETMTGRVSQVAPPYSAVKHKGRALYRYARAGGEVPRLTREVRMKRGLSPSSG